MVTPNPTKQQYVVILVQLLKMTNFFSFSALALSALLMLQGCATPAEKFIGAATQSGFSHQELDGTPYKHLLFVNQEAKRANPIEELHVYLDGDGTPWKSGTRIADDPTPRNPLILEMMEKDHSPALLLGRPCYYGLNLSHLCNNTLWTSHRYSKAVVDSMLEALEHWMATRKINRLVLIGFSGGGALATLLASRLKNVSTVITVAANLDIKAWSDHHGYLQPSGSLNPMLAARIPDHVRQIHLAGLKDDNVPAKIIEAFSSRQKNALYVPYSDYSHACCWTDIWPDILKTYLKP